MTPNFRHFFPLALLPFLAACGGRSGGDGAAAPPERVQPVEVMPIERITLQETVNLVGTIAANESAALRAEIPGTIVEITFNEGQTVSHGDTLMRLDTRELEAQLAETRASYELAERTLERTRSLAVENAVSRLELDTATAEHARLRAAIDLLEVRIEKSTITAPFDGFSGARVHSIGDFITPESVVTTIDDLSRLKVEMDVPERYLPLLQPGATFRMSTATAGRDEQVSGEVYFVSPRIDAQTRSTQVKGYVVDPPPYLKPGMFAGVTLILRTVEDALAVPETAILNTPRGTVLITPETDEDGNTVAAYLPVKTGIRTADRVEVIAVGPPVEAGRMIVSAGVGGLILFPGARIEPVEAITQPGPQPITDRRLE
jgi:membrane fusion protein (multidrug efflux system)